MSLREEKARQIVTQRANIKRSGNLWLVPSQSGRGRYKVDAKAKTCTCLDFEYRQKPCKHIYAAEFLERTLTVTTTTTPEGKTTTTKTETIKIKRQTYRQVWPAYNQAQTQEKKLFRYLLHQLCQGVGSPAQYGRGQRRLPMEDMLFAMAYKVYSTVSGRRFMTDLRDAHAKGYVSQLPSYNSIFHYFESEALTPHLQMLIEESALPLGAVEQDFAVDSSGLSSSRFVQWTSAKYVDPQLIEQRDWVKVHLMCGVKTNVVTAVEISNKFANDSPYFKPLVDSTAERFYMQEVSADRAYLSVGNLQTVNDHVAMPYIPFKSNSRKAGTAATKKNPLWKRMYHYYEYNQESFMQHYHKRSNVESTFHMIKSKFGDSLRSKTKTALINEALCKVLCHNICCLIQSMFELNLKPKFWAEVA
jgi:transposase